MNSRDLPNQNTTKINIDIGFNLDANSNQKTKWSSVDQNVISLTSTSIGLFGKQPSTTDIEKIEKPKEQYPLQDKEVATNIKDAGYLEIKTIQKMLNRFLLEKRMSQEALAHKLDTTTQELGQLLLSKETCAISVLRTLIAKINLPLIKLYCETKWS